jgi:hypothetical protein
LFGLNPEDIVFVFDPEDPLPVLLPLYCSKEWRGLYTENPQLVCCFDENILWPFGSNFVDA